MARSLIFEYDPATGQTLASELPDDLLEVSLADIAEDEPTGEGAPVLAAETNVSVPTPLASRSSSSSAPASAVLAAPGASLHHSRQSAIPAAPGQSRAALHLSEVGKAKLRRAVKSAGTLEQLTEIERALDSGQLSEGLAARLRLSTGDFLPAAAHSQQAPAPDAPAMPLGAQVLTTAGLLKVRSFIEQATDLEKLAEVDRALHAGDIYRLQVMLNLKAEDIVQKSQEKSEAPDASTGGPRVQEEDADYDPFATEPAASTAKEPTAAKQPEQASKQKKVTAAKSSAKKKAKKQNQKSKKTGALGSLQSAYNDDCSSSEGKVKKKQRKDDAASQTIAWPMAWVSLMSRTQQHPDFRAPTLTAETKWAEEAGDMDEVPSMLAIATSLVYVGDAAHGYDPRYLGRLVAVDQEGNSLLDLHVRPQAKLLDCRTHITGIKSESLEASAGAQDLQEVRAALLKLLRPRTILIGHRLAVDLEALKLWHGPVVDLALVFPVDSRKRFQYHPLRYLAERVLLMATASEETAEPEPQDALEAARLAMRLARHEAAEKTPTPSFPPREGSDRKLVVRHIPGSWGKFAAQRLCDYIPRLGNSGQVSVRWLLSETDPTEWRGEAFLFFEDSNARDAVFTAAAGLTDVHVQWEDAPDAPPLGALLTEQALVEAFSSFGMVVCARIPRRPITQEPQSFAFISFLDAQDAQRVARKQGVEVAITPTWNLELKARLAKFGGTTDKRVAVKAGAGDEDDVGFDWIHLSK
eukprot:TRINITY_DN104890_c0_g1_i1.p1 TRINITY_DN104890_c0_g1~~TRINITY_DN104890_c0_g1_i1.p1  ORF type:complete len:751 (-),score=162.65 TRINITY_DN104890_c0_g1_i1:32-2284(-)